LGTAANATAPVPAPSRWRPRNPFSSIHFPILGRARQASTAEPAAEPTPAQLEAGTVAR
jgi:hypothetical protein